MVQVMAVQVVEATIEGKLIDANKGRLVLKSKTCTSGALLLNEVRYSLLDCRLSNMRSMLHSGDSVIRRQQLDATGPRHLFAATEMVEQRVATGIQLWVKTYVLRVESEVAAGPGCGPSVGFICGARYESCGGISPMRLPVHK